MPVTGSELSDICSLHIDKIMSKVLVGVTGSVAAIKLPKLVASLQVRLNPVCDVLG